MKQSACARRKRQKKDIAIQYFHYCVWARECLKSDIGLTKISLRFNRKFLLCVTRNFHQEPEIWTFRQSFSSSLKKVFAILMPILQL